MDHAGRGVFVATVSFEHGTLAIIGHRLRFTLIVIQRRGFPVAPVQSVGEDVHIGEALATRVEIPNVIDRPQMLLGNESLQTFPRGNRWPRAGLRVETVSPARLIVRQPVHRRHVFIRPGHLHTRLSTHLGRLLRCRRERGIRPIQILEDGQVHFLDSCRRGVVAAIQEHARMIAKNSNLAPQRFPSNLVLLGFPVFPLLPSIATGPAGHHQNAQAVGLFEKLLAVDSPFEADRVQAHVADVIQISIQARRRPAEEHVGRPSRSANQNLPAVDLE